MVVNACLAKGSTAMGKKQTIVKNINAMQSFGSMDILCVDKTGTLTKGVFKVEEVHTCGELSEDKLLRYAAYAEANSSHPISVSLREDFEEKSGEKETKNVLLFRRTLYKTLKVTESLQFGRILKG